MSAAWRRASPARGCFGLDPDATANAAALAAALGGLKGPIMKVAQLLATIPEALPPEYAAELTKLQSQAPPMGWPFVQRRMAAELGADWQSASRASSTSRRRRPRSARCIARAPHDGARSPASCNIPTWSRRSKRISQLDMLFAITALRPGDRHDARSSRRSPRGCARSSTTSARRSTCALYRTMLAEATVDPRAAGAGPSCRRGAC